VGILDYLNAKDLRNLHQISKNIREFFRSIILFPGLFKTFFGDDNQCRLHSHQLASLSAMRQIENQSDEFGALRGGILADAPGLGKTVTAIALVMSTCGLLPRQPSVFWNMESINQAWTNLRG
jgi:SNF2 family DNA or RNA helicase